MGNDYDKIEGELIREEQERRRLEMEVSGKSVFDLKKIIGKENPNKRKED